MSYILQALKKSELERAQATADNSKQEQIIEADTAPQTEPKISSSWSLYFVYLSLLAVLILILWKIFSVPAALLETEAELEPQPFFIEESPHVVESISHAKSDDTEDNTGREINVSTEAVAIERAPNEILTRLPVMEITSHIYSTQAQRRSIVVNGERLVEGDYIAPNLQVKKITPQGMVVNIEGWSLLVARSRGWGQ